MTTVEAITLLVPDGEVSGLWLAPAQPRACLVLAHGAGAGMNHKSMTAIAEGLGALGVASLRYQFPYMEQGRKRVDPPTIAHAAVRTAVRAARERGPELPLFAGGRSFGGRMTSQAQAGSALEGVRGLIFFGFPLHPAGKPSTERALHLTQVSIPMLFVQGTNDALAQLPLLEGVLADLGPAATSHLLPEGDHSFHVPVRSGRKDGEVLEEALRVVAGWMTERC